MKTVTIQIGNSDDKLTQKEWSEFVKCIGFCVVTLGKHTHFFGGSATFQEWQNVCWVFEIEEKKLEALKAKITETRKEYKQDSVAFGIVDTEFI